MSKMLKVASLTFFTAVTILLLQTNGQARTRYWFYDGFNYDGYSYLSSEGLDGDCNYYCHHNLNAGGGACYGEAYGDCFNCGGEGNGWCQCTDCVPIG